MRRHRDRLRVSSRAAMRCHTPAWNLEGISTSAFQELSFELNSSDSSCIWQATVFHLGVGKTPRLQKTLATFSPLQLCAFPLDSSVQELLKVGEVAEQAGVHVQTLHFYERSGLLPKPKRSEANYRLYSPDLVRRVQFIKKAQTFGFTLEEIGDILDLKDHGKAPCRRVAEIAGERLRAIETELSKWRNFRRALTSVLPQWEHETALERECAGDFCDLIERLR